VTAPYPKIDMPFCRECQTDDSCSLIKENEKPGEREMHEAFSLVHCPPHLIRRVGQNHTYIRIYSVYTAYLAGKLPYIRPYYTVLANPTSTQFWHTAFDKTIRAAQLYHRWEMPMPEYVISDLHMRWWQSLLP